MSNRRYADAIDAGLDAALARAVPLFWDADSDRTIVVSDHHRGQGDHADDFRRCAETYRTALEFYLHAGYRLVTLGDAEELWEGWPGKVVPYYREILELEHRFHSAARGRLLKIWGNHDDLWRYPAQVAKHLGPIFGEIQIPEAVLVTVRRGGEPLGRVFLVHGHQGTGPSDRWKGLSRHFVRWVWRPIQRLLKISLNTPATDFEIRSRHDRAMFEWAARRRDLVLIAGHTHNPVFVSAPHVPTLERVHQHLCATPDCKGQAAMIDREIDWARRESSRGRRPGGSASASCYFNSGCCCFSNGDITGIELADGEIRLIRWTREPMDPSMRIVERRPFDAVVAGIVG